MKGRCTTQSHTVLHCSTGVGWILKLSCTWTYLSLFLHLTLFIAHTFFVSLTASMPNLSVSFFPGLVDPTVLVEPLTEERAARTLYRIELLRKIREQVGRLHHEGRRTKGARVEHLLGTLLLSPNIHSLIRIFEPHVWGIKGAQKPTKRYSYLWTGKYFDQAFCFVFLCWLNSAP